MGFPHRIGVVVGACLFLSGMTRQTRADFLYSLQTTGVVGSSGFNNSQGSEAEDNFVANSFTVVTAGTHITAVSFLAEDGNISANQPATVAIYTGSSLTNPQAGSGLVRVATGSTMLTAAPAGTAQTQYTINLAQPVDLPVGQVFYAGLLLPDLTTFPFATYAFSTPLGRSFFDVGPTLGAPYNLDNTANLTVLGGTHPVVGANVQSPGNLVLWAVATPEPGGLIAVCGPLMALLLRRRRTPSDSSDLKIAPRGIERLEARTLLSGWATVDSLPPSNWFNPIDSMAADSAGNIYAVGSYNGNGIVREKPAGSSAFQTVPTTLPTIAGASSTQSEFYSVGTDAAGDAFLSGYANSYNSSGNLLGQTPFILKSPAGQNNFSAVPVNTNIPSGDKLSFSRYQAFAADAAGDVYVLGSLAVPTGTTGHGSSQKTTYTNYGTLFEMPAGQSSFSVVYQSSTFDPSSITVISSGPSAGIYVSNYNAWSISKSTNGGTTWTTLGSFVYDPNLPASDTVSYAIASDSNGNGNIFVTGYGSQRVITGYTTTKGKTTPVYTNYDHWITRRSSDGGATWTTMDDYQPSPTSSVQAYAVADVGGTLYVAGSGKDGIIRTNANGTWQTAEDDPDDYYGSVAIDPTTMTAYAGFDDGIYGIRSGGAPATGTMAIAASTAGSTAGTPAATAALASATFSSTQISGADNPIDIFHRHAHKG